MQLPNRWQAASALFPLLSCLLLWAALGVAMVGLELLGVVTGPQKDALHLLGMVASAAALAHGVAALVSRRSRFAPLVVAVAAGTAAALVATHLAAQRGVYYGLWSVAGLSIVFAGVAWVAGSRART